MAHMYLLMVLMLNIYLKDNLYEYLNSIVKLDIQNNVDPYKIHFNCLNLF
jgi:hypothetical protein